eukprot:TRINITY_DN4520_c0_g1_i1.p1 TRINITY_DN4520_c0_g1~~TRINITY_DN4520_c0_g1_i1.p1  ORF type:complete len:768 (+),score=172.26 TRINITY_DN4520_c0_g1_i1:106-2304(+)
MSSLIHSKKSKSRSIASLVGASSSLMGPITAHNGLPEETDGEEDQFYGNGHYVSASSGYDSHSIASPERHYSHKTASLDYRNLREGPNGIEDSLRRRNTSRGVEEIPCRIPSEMQDNNSRKSSTPKASSRLGSFVSSNKKKTTKSSPSREEDIRRSGKAEMSALLAGLKPDYSFRKMDKHAFDRGWLRDLTPYMFKFLEWSVVILLIYLGFNAVYILLLFILYAYQIHTSESARRLALFGRIPTSEFLSRIDRDILPAWLKTPEMDRTEWINELIAQLWPNLNRYSTHFIKTFVEPELVDMLQELQLKELSGFEIRKVLLGSIPLKVGGVRVFPRGNRSEKDGIILEMELFYSGDARVQFVVQRIAAEIKNVNFRGVVRVNLKPLLNTFPLIGGCEVTFMQLPSYNYSLGGIGTFADLPGVSSLVKSIVDSQIKSRVLWPNKLQITLPIPESPENAKQRAYISRPFGYLAVQVIEAENLVAKDLSMVGKGTSDPYAVVLVNGRKVSFQSQYVEKNLNPIWDYECDFILDGDLIPEDHQCEILVYDYDQGTQDDFMGNAVIDLSSVFKQGGEFDQWVPLANIKKGKVHLRMNFRECVPVLSAEGDYLLHVYVESCSNLLNEAGSPLQSPIDICINEAHILSQRGRFIAEEGGGGGGVHHVDDGLTFFSSSQEELSIVVRDRKSPNKVWGDYRLPLRDLVKNFDGEIDNEALPLNFHSDSKMVVSIRAFSLAEV